MPGTGWRERVVVAVLAGAGMVRGIEVGTWFVVRERGTCESVVGGRENFVPGREEEVGGGREEGGLVIAMEGGALVVTVEGWRVMEWEGFSSFFLSSSSFTSVWRE